jgi:hypothetical protein
VKGSRIPIALCTKTSREVTKDTVMPPYLPSLPLLFGGESKDSEDRKRLDFQTSCFCLSTEVSVKI